MIIIPTHLEELPDKPLSVEPLVSVLKKKLKNPRQKMIRPWLRAKYQQFVKVDEPEKPEPIFASEI